MTDLGIKTPNQLLQLIWGNREPLVKKDGNNCYSSQNHFTTFLPFTMYIPDGRPWVASPAET